MTDVVLGGSVDSAIQTSNDSVGTLNPTLDTPTINVSTEVAETARKPRAPRTPKVVERGRGRPNVYVGDVLKLMIAMIRCCLNCSLVREVLTASGRSEHVAARKALGFAKPMTISLPMLGKYAKDAGVELPKGRPTFAAVEKQKQKLTTFITKRTAVPKAA